jgi:hypothetical protein
VLAETGIDSSFTLAGQTAAHLPQPMHVVASTNEALRFTTAWNFPGSPSRETSSEDSMMSMFLWNSPLRMQNWLEESRSVRGSILHMPQWSEGNWWSSLVRSPPICGRLSIRATLCPASARSRADRMPPMPAPTTRAS